MQRRNRVFVAMAAAVLALTTIGAHGDTVLEPRTETLYISAACPPDDTGSCTSTRWLGRTTGDATSNYRNSITPVDEVFYRVNGSLNWRDYPSDSSIRAEGYPLRADEDIAANVRLTSTGPGIEARVHARIDAIKADGSFVQFGPLEEAVTLMPNSTTDVGFDFDIPEELEGVTLDSLTFFVALHGVNVNAGYINQQGGSTVEIPYWLEVHAPEEPSGG